MAVFSKPGGCCGASELYLDTEKVSEQARRLEEAGNSVTGLVGSVDFAGAASALGSSSLATIIGNGVNVLDPALTSHAGLMSSTSAGFTQVVSEVSKQDQHSADGIAQVTA